MNPPARRAHGATSGDATGKRWYRAKAETFAAPHDSLGATLAALARDGVERIYLCGKLPPDGTIGGFRRWVEQAGGWAPRGPQYMTADQPRLRFERDGRAVEVVRAAPWYGEQATPDDCAAAHAQLAGAVFRAGGPLLGNPAATGRVMLHNAWAAAGETWAPLDVDTARLIRSTSGQGRFELFPAAKMGGAGLWRYDGRFMYGALAGAELPVGEPEHAGTVDLYAPGRWLIDFTVPRDWRGPGLVGVMNTVGGWSYPATPGMECRTWVDGAELHLLAEHEWPAVVRDGLVWRHKARPLARWLRPIVKARESARDPLVAGALRAIVIQTIGALHGRGQRATIPAAVADPPPDAEAPVLIGGVWHWQTRPADQSMVHPEWTAHIWALARVRLARRMLDVPAGELVGCALDAIYTSAEQAHFRDDGRPGTFRPAGAWAAPWRPLHTMPDLYRATTERATS